MMIGSNFKSITCVLSNEIGDKDVLCGSKKKTCIHCGNRRYRHVIEMYRLAYKTATTKLQKTKIAYDIVQSIRSSGARFLKEDETKPGEWYDIGNIHAREKVSHALWSAVDPNRPRRRKRHTMKPHIPTPQENKIFQQILQDQKQTFHLLMGKETTESNQELQ